MTSGGLRQIRAVFDSASIRVYQAYSDGIADAALARGAFVCPPFSLARMTWIKPSFLWMMYRSGWGFKDSGQKRILAVDISRSGFEKALGQAVISHYIPDAAYTHDQWRKDLDKSSVRIQWDPERDLNSSPLNQRSIQIGLRGAAIQQYVFDWIISITEVTPLAHEIFHLVRDKKYDQAQNLLPKEQVYPLPKELALHIHADV